MGRKMIDRTGEENYNNYGSLMKIVDYKNANDIIVEFRDEYKIKVNTQYGNFKNGKVKNPYDKSMYKVGYLGNGEYTRDNHLNIYYNWSNMLQRCYDPYFINKNTTYINCYVCEEWHNF